MEDYLILITGYIISSVIYSIIFFQFIEERYERLYSNNVMYVLMKIGVCVLVTLINMLNIPVLNMLSWLVSFGVVTVMLYSDYGRKMLQRFFEVESLIIVMTVCETVGYFLLELLVWKLNIVNVNETVAQFLYTTFSKIFIIVLYYSVITKLWRKTKPRKFTIADYVLYLIIIVYSTVNLAVIIIVVSNDMAQTTVEKLLLLINMICIVFAVMYLLYFTKFVEENGDLKVKLSLLEQQSNLQYEYYAAQESKYNETVKVLHDANKHLNMIESIYEQGEQKAAKKYTEEIVNILKPLVMHEYTNNPILNILLNDKKKRAQLLEIKLDIEVGAVDFKFMDGVDVTTVFGNLIDNAIEACRKVEGEKYISVELDSFNSFTRIKIHNTTVGKNKWKSGKPVSSKKGNHGIGLMNVESVVKKYGGDLQLSEENEIFMCNIIIPN